MIIRILGSAAGGGVPQWNCNCPNCRSARRGDGAVRPRTQSSLAISPGGDQWLLINASPDIREQINRFGPFHTGEDSRGTTIQSVILTDAEIDHASGVLFLREAGQLTLRTTQTVRDHLNSAFNLIPTLEAFSAVNWKDISFDGPFLRGVGFEISAISLPGNPPTYTSRSSSDGDTIGLEIRDFESGRIALYLPAIGDLPRSLQDRITRSNVAFLDGTFWSRDEIASVTGTEVDAMEMGHLPVGGPSGSLSRLSTFTDVRKIYVHINNTNPMLHPESDERRQVEEAGFEVPRDGLTVTI